MPAIAKRPEDRQRRNVPATLGDFTTSLAIPLPPEGISGDLRHKWGLLWTSPVAALFDPVSDRPAVARLFELYHLGARMEELVAQARPEGVAALAVRDLDEQTALTVAEAVAEGSAARQAFNSTVGARMRVATETRMLEAQLGLSPRSRLVLGLTLLANRKAGSLDDAVDDADDDA